MADFNATVFSKHKLPSRADITKAHSTTLKTWNDFFSHSEQQQENIEFLEKRLANREKVIAELGDVDCGDGQTTAQQIPALKKKLVQLRGEVEKLRAEAVQWEKEVERAGKVAHEACTAKEKALSEEAARARRDQAEAEAQNKALALEVSNLKKRLAVKLGT